MKRKIILDCDPGHDDAIAILAAVLNDSLELIGISTISGNQTVEKTSNNALSMIEFLNINIPVAIGSSHPLIKEPMICSEIHGETGIDGFVFPPHTQKFSDKNGCDLIIDLCMNNDKVTVVTTGPMTNLAMALNKNPLIKDHIEEVVFMGGSIGSGNMTPAAEFNILVDPEAADIVINSGLKVKMVGLDVTRKVLVLPSIIDRMSKLNTKCSDLFTKLMVVFNMNQQRFFGIEAGPLHDPATIVSLLDESVIKFTLCNVQIDLSKGISYGRTNCDIEDVLHQNKNVYVATDINVVKYWDIIENVLKRY